MMITRMLAEVPNKQQKLKPRLCVFNILSKHQYWNCRTDLNEISPGIAYSTISLGLNFIRSYVSRNQSFNATFYEKHFSIFQFFQTKIGSS